MLNSQQQRLCMTSHCMKKTFENIYLELRGYFNLFTKIMDSGLNWPRVNSVREKNVSYIRQVLFKEVVKKKTHRHHCIA